MDINIDALYNILKQNQGDVNDALGYKKKAIVVTSNPLALVAEKTKITALLAKAFNRKKYYAKPTNNNLRTSSASSFANKRPEYVKSVENYGLFVNNDDDQEIFHDAIESVSENFIKNHIDSQKDNDKSEVDHNNSEEKEHLVDKLIRKFNHKIAKCQKR
nr:RNA-directed DNA polymerase, eukaryota [Tanacetum cinerariifolium]